jgi:hypothetical protein
MLRPVRFLFAAIAGAGALLGAGCTSVPAHPSSPMHGMQDGQMRPAAEHGPGPQAGMLEQMRIHHRCVESEMAKRPDGGRAMPDKAAMAAMMQRCPMSSAMHGSMMMMMQQGQPAEPAGEHQDHPAPAAPAHSTQPDEQ